jgi:hypothetical protein
LITLEQFIAKVENNSNIKEKELMQLEMLKALTIHHSKSCCEYSQIILAFFDQLDGVDCIENIPFIPIGLFKLMDLKSVPDSKIVRTLNSSGTSNFNVSKIHLDKINTINQLKVLQKILFSSISTQKHPMIFLDHPAKGGADENINARSAATKGFSILASESHYILNENNELQIELLTELSEKYSNSEVIFFGFTSMIWTQLLMEIEKRRLSFDFKKATLIHGGGWKNLTKYEVSNEKFKDKISYLLGIKKVINYYGMAEQTGSLYFECSQGFFHCTAYGTVVMRSFKDFSIAKYGEQGIVQVLSVIPTSYPGHSILTEDVGAIYGDGDCECGGQGRYFKIFGRLPDAEIRGCSDVYGEF